MPNLAPLRFVLLLRADCNYSLQSYLCYPSLFWGLFVCDPFNVLIQIASQNILHIPLLSSSLCPQCRQHLFRIRPAVALVSTSKVIVHLVATMSVAGMTVKTQWNQMQKPERIMVLLKLRLVRNKGSKGLCSVAQVRYMSSYLDRLIIA